MKLSLIFNRRATSSTVIMGRGSSERFPSVNGIVHVSARRGPRADVMLLGLVSDTSTVAGVSGMTVASRDAGHRAVGLVALRDVTPPQRSTSHSVTSASTLD